MKIWSQECFPLKKQIREFPGDPVVKMMHFHSRGHKFHPWLGELRPHMLYSAAKKLNKKWIILGGLFLHPFFFFASILMKKTLWIKTLESKKNNKNILIIYILCPIHGIDALRKQKDTTYVWCKELNRKSTT